MKKSKKILLAGLLVVFTLSTMLAGCGPSQNANTEASTTSNAEASTTAPAATETTKLEPFQMDWYYIGNGPQADQALIEEELNKMNEDIKLKVKIHALDWGSYEEKMATCLATGEKVDLMFSATWGSNVYINIRKGYITDITELLPKYAPDAVEALKDVFYKGTRMGGKNYTIPTLKEEASAVGVLLNKKMVDKYGFDISSIKTLEDLEPMFKVIKEKEPGVIPCQSVDGEGPYKLIINQNTGIPGISYDALGGTDKYMINIHDKAYQDCLKTTRKFYMAGYIRKDAAAVKEYMPDAKAGKLFAIWNELKPGKDAEMTNSTGVEWVQVMMTKPYTFNSVVSGSMMAIPKACEKPERVLMFYNKFYKDPKIVNLMNFGIENKHYVVKSPGIIDFAPGTDGGAKSGWNPGTPWMFGNTFLTYLFPNEDPNKWDKFKAFNAEAVRLPNTGFVFNDEAFKNEAAAINNADVEFRPGLTTGTMDPEVFLPKFEAKLKAAGVEKILADVNKQYDAWKQANNK